MKTLQNHEYRYAESAHCIACGSLAGTHPHHCPAAQVEPEVLEDEVVGYAHTAPVETCHACDAIDRALGEVA